MRTPTGKAKVGQFVSRCIAIGSVIAIVFVVCFGQLINLQLLNGRWMAEAAAAGRTLQVPVHAMRGKILDANGAVLAQSVERYTIIGDPEAAQAYEPLCNKQVSNNCIQPKSQGGRTLGVVGAAQVARLIAPILGMDAKEVGGKLAGSGRYAVLKKNVEPADKRKLDKLGLGGIVYGELCQNRAYSDGNLLGAFLGGVDDKTNGASGMEQLENKALSGSDGYKVYQQGNNGVEIPDTLTDSKAARNGSDVKLTIDADVDWFVKKVLTDGKSRFGADWAVACVMDVQTHQIIALEDSDNILAGSDQAKLSVSRAVSETFEPGSIGKTFTVAGLMQHGVHQLGDRFQVPDHLDKNKQQYRDSDDHPISNWTLAGIFAQSSNVGMLMASDNYRDEDRYDMLTKFGIGQSTGLNLPGESSGTLTTPKVWDGRTRDTVLFGQGYSTSIIQLTNAVATVADGGVYRKPSIIVSRTDSDGHVINEPQDQGTRILDPNVNAQLMNAMESAADHYQQTVGVNGYRVAGKSGTAQVAGSGGRLTGIVGDWTGILPADNPRFVVTVAMKNPQGTYGGITSGTLFKQIGEFLMQKYEVPASSPRTDAIPVSW
ncbi:cell division protein FtsI (penicillin-binding protein 3) [Bifidobacterium commune]|uniref:Cell division protein FtsI (Penicillin-binding protein 3) n=1 Tax=Bifidobacterium commune TaxID=1505727 RepID=A0A1C4GZY4_9BIFI|nr:penicillin-binding protein 2 [Bifidobacterium commune]MBB2955184.1 cell division protein FtsI (penicillin-binding protein 3) [Bifidobacterium commune]SCC78225.1 cell division protein FtsI (penicillin-binding protein 3) [Bifidobacterium commune]